MCDDYFECMTRARNSSAAALIVLIGAVSTVAAAERPAGFDPRRHIAVDEVRPGMIGYGLSVFRGTEVETFDVEVVSVEHGWQPGKSVVWVRCTDERMQKLGPVSGMSGSPIYLWPPGTDKGDRRPGEGGRLLGAFAFGYSMGKDCYVGIQPIAQMLAASERAREPNDVTEAPNAAPDAASAPNAPADPNDPNQPSDPNNARPAAAHRVGGLAHALRAAELLNVPKRQAWRVRALGELLDVEAANAPSAAPTSDRRLMLPVMAGTQSHARMLRPWLEPLGLTPVAGGGGPTGQPPAWINPRTIEIEPGGVASVPLVAGDMDLAAVGTITEVLRDANGDISRVLAFGHAFNGIGQTNLPFATGYVHYVQPNLASSFKLGGSGQVFGALINDEMTAVVGAPNVDHPFAPATVKVDWPGESKDRTFHYKLARDPYYTPVLAAYTVVFSLATDTAIPPYHTLEANSTVHFTDGRSLDLRSLTPGGAAFALMFDVAGPLMTLVDSPFGETHIDRVETRVTVRDEMQQATITDLSVRKSVVAPGETLRVAVELLPFRGTKVRKTLTLDVPEDVAEGQYLLTISGAQMYWRRYLEAHPHLQRVTDQKALFEMIERMAAMRTDALYVILSLRGEGEVAVGRTEMPDLPSSRRAMLLQHTSTAATQYMKTVDKVEPLDYVIQGQMRFPVQVKHRPEADDQRQQGAQP